MKLRTARIIILVFLFCGACGLPIRGSTRVQLSSADLPKDLVLIGTVTRIYPVASWHSRRNWAVLAHVDKVVSGAFSGTTFTFTVHSPATAGLRVGHAYTIKAVWTIEGYVVNEFTLKEARALTKPLSVGAIVSKEDIAEFSVSNLILHNGDLKPSIEKKVDGITYRMAYETKSRKIVQISTFHRSFKSSDGLQVGSFVKARREQIISTESAVLGPKTADGWHPVLGHDYDIVVLKDGVESRLSLGDESWTARTAKKGIRKLFGKSESASCKLTAAHRKQASCWVL